MTGPLRTAFRALGDGGAHFLRRHGMVYSAAMAFNILLSLIPILFLAFAAASLLIGSTGLPYDELLEVIRGVFPAGAKLIVGSLKGLVQQKAAFGAVGGGLLLFSSYSLTDTVHTCLSVMTGLRRKRQMWRSALFHVALVLLLTLLTCSAILFLPVWHGLTLLRIGRFPILDAAFSVLLHAVSAISLAVMVFLVGLFSYRYLAPVAIRWRNAVLGSLLFTSLLYLVKWGFTFYLRKFSKLNVIYGSLFGVVAFIIVAYLFAAAFLYAASVLGVLQRGEREAAMPVEPDEEPAGGD